MGSVLARFLRGVVFPAVGLFGTNFLTEGQAVASNIKNQTIGLLVGAGILAVDKWWRDFTKRSGIPTP